MNFIRQKLSDFNRKNKEDVRWAWNELGLKKYNIKIFAAIIIFLNLIVYPFLIFSFVLILLSAGALGLLKLLPFIVSWGGLK